MSYAVLLIVLFAISAIAVQQVIAYLESSISISAYRVAVISIWTLTLGFMLIAGAFGLWAIQFSAESESRRRIGQLVETIDYMSDGLVALDHRGRITAMNPTARRIAGLKDVRRGPVRGDEAAHGRNGFHSHACRAGSGLAGSDRPTFFLRPSS